MKTLLAAATIAVLAIAILEIAQSDAHRPGHGHGQRRCPERERPVLNTTAVTCDNGPRHRPSRPLDCARRCINCYDRETLQRPVSCRVNGTCTCLARPGNASTTTTQASVSTTPVIPVTGDPTGQPTTVTAAE
ncbi:unnamed protein product [Orchesella dallaii]|uniref:Uncharacterized protein n=1 Tax=Orchesella dallaii TaxID=48710 RepID=A0ABP1RSC9_9HEXA